MASVSVRSGFLYFDFRCRGQRCREYTKLPDNPANRRKMEAVLKKIEADIAFNRFDYARYFPGSAMAKRFAGINGSVDGRMTPSHGTASSDTPLFSDFVEIWWRDREIEWRHSYRTAVDSILKTHLLPACKFALKTDPAGVRRKTWTVYAAPPAFASKIDPPGQA